MDAYDRLSRCTGFDWDEANLFKNWDKHRVSASECEQIFFNRPLLAQPDPAHSHEETRYYVLGQTDSSRKLFVVFTIREDLIRVISAREMTRRERTAYQKYG